MANAPAPAQGTRPEGVESEADASRKVREMFSQIAPRYDLLNHLLSFQLDRIWRKRTAKLLRPVLEQGDARVLDLCCGTGDLAITIARRYKVDLIGADFARTMLTRAREKSVSLHSPTPAPLRPIQLVEADALRLPFADNSFNLVTSAFGFRNLANYEAGLCEIHRVLKPGGTIAILEFTEPPDTFLGNIYRWYFRRVLPRIGAILSGDSAAYTYLPNSVSRFFRPAELSSLMSAAGFVSANFHLWNFGSVALHTAQRPL
ncbi:MAG TPA: bifunctional demethylmenaquinone methyltransferase/2-methoxy-6-polyprenyl-1,4-benzoquinol methylase UbiE [Candidatus Acidoferrum sp.]|nr:bifunctional demethylmenaquinone methyltransferase/2-methoxy-6-polyprenyl-1,4-benzoquinol methylase UbiE [Candidatus Acidoferrum sp.]